MKSFIAQLRWLFTPQDKRKFIFITLLMAFSALLELLGIGILMGAAALFLSSEEDTENRFSEILENIFPAADAGNRIAFAICFIGILLAAKNIFAYLIVTIQAKFVFAKRDELAKRLMANLLYADYETYSKLSHDYCFGSFNRLSDIGNLVLLPSMQILADFQVIALLTVTSVILFPAVSLSGIGFMLLAAITVSALTGRANKKYGRELLTSSLEENRARQACIAGEKIIKCSAKEEYFLHKFSSTYAKMDNVYRKLYNLGQLPRLSLESASILLASGVFAVMILLDVPKTGIMLTFAVLTAVIGRILPALSRCHYNMTLIRQNYPQLQQFCDLLRNIPKEPAPRGTAADAGQTIKFEHVTFAYDGVKEIFSDFSLTIEPHTSLAIAGKSGRGKSTLIDLLTGLLKPASGIITAGNLPIANDLAQWRRQIGIVPQNIFLLEGTVAENVAFGEENIDFAKVRKALHSAGLPDFEPEFKLTGQGNLSGGQRQRIGIARALYKDAKILILDEATSALDAETENAFCEVLKGLHGKVTLIVISHRESTLKSCDKLLSL